LTIAGKLSDGSAITMATFAGPTGQMLLFRPLYGTKLPVMGSILGTLDITPGVTPVDNTVSDVDLTWLRPANTATANRLYRSGFPSNSAIPSVLSASVTGARYVAPTKPNPRVMGLSDGANEIEVLLTEAGVATALPAMPVVKANVSTTNKVTFSTTPNPNTRKVSLTFVGSTGAFNGKFTLVEPNPVVPTATVTRTVSYLGMIVKNKGEGYFILNQLPAVGAVPAQTPSNSPQEGGKVVVQPVPVVP
jgi:hypothetical protein